MANSFGFIPDEENYYFVSYFSRNQAILFQTASICRKLHDKVNLWYDNGIHDGSDWQKTIAEHLENAKAIIMFVCNEFFMSDERQGESGLLLEYSIAIKQKQKIVIPVFLNRINPSTITNSFSWFYSSLDRLQCITLFDCISNEEAAEKIYSRLFNFLAHPSIITPQSDMSGYQHHDYIDWINRFMNWAMNLPQKWGTYDNSHEPQIANTLEGLLAMYFSGFSEKKPQQFKRALDHIIQHTDENGTISGTLNKESVIHTSMLLFIIARISAEEKTIDNSLLISIAHKLWDIRNGDSGWGIFMEKTQSDECHMVNTYWALSALNYYLNDSQKEEYCKYVCQFYEYETDGNFGYCIGEKPQLIVSAMFLNLYFEMDLNVKTQIEKVFPIKDCIKYVFSNLVENNIQVNVESFSDMLPPLLQYSSKRKALWNHVTIGFALCALSKAFINGAMTKQEFQKVLCYVDSVLNENTIIVNSNKAIYHPLGIELPRCGHYTFPTFHFIVGLSELNKGVKMFNNEHDK